MIRQSPPYTSHWPCPLTPAPTPNNLLVFFLITFIIRVSVTSLFIITAITGCEWAIRVTTLYQPLTLSLTSSLHLLQLTCLLPHHFHNPSLCHFSLHHHCHQRVSMSHQSHHSIPATDPVPYLQPPPPYNLLVFFLITFIIWVSVTSLFITTTIRGCEWSVRVTTLWWGHLSGQLSSPMSSFAASMLQLK